MRVLFVVKYTGDEYLGIMGISSFLKEKGHLVEMVEAKYEKVMYKLKADIPTVLAYSVPSMLAKYYLDVNKKIKENHKVFSVFGGPHPTSEPEMIAEEGVDGVCIGEGEFAMLELVDNLASVKPIRNIKNWWIKENGKIFKNPLRALLEDLSSLPSADRDLFKKQYLFDQEKIHIITGRGCPYSCSYCCHSYYNQLYDGQTAKIRKRSVQNVIEEIGKFKKEFPLKFVMFDDDIFILPFEWLKNFSYQYKKDINLPFFCYVRADLINSKVVSYLKSAGCFSISMGVETADDCLRNRILKRSMSKEQIISAARMIKEQNIKLKTSNIIGIPGGSLDGDLETLSLNITCRADYSSVEKLRLYPKTEISKIVRNNNNTAASFFYLENKRLRRQIENLGNLFALTVEYPFLFHFIRILIRLPLSKLYKFFYLFWEGYCAHFRLYPAGKRNFIRGVKKYTNLLRNQI